MTSYRAGKTGMALAAIIAAAMCLLSYLFQPERPLSGQPGICLPPPSEWEMSPFISWMINTLLLGACAIGMWLLNRNFNFVRTTEPVLPALFLILCSSNPWLCGFLSSSVIMLVVNILAIWIIFTCAGSSNATQEMFAMATFLSVGSMFQYAFIPMMLIFLIAAFVVKILRIKEFIAFILGVVSPYWIALGFGWISPESFRLPSPFPLFSDTSIATDLFILMVSIGTMVFMGVLTGVADSMRIYAGNSAVSAMNTVIYWLGIGCVVCMLADFNNLLAYEATLSFTVAVQLANFCALRELRHEWLVTFIPSLIFIGYYILFML